MRHNAWILLVAICGWPATYGFAEDAPATPKVTYDDHIKDIFRAKCANCHNTDKKTAGLDLTNYTAMMQGGASGPSIESGDASLSYLWMVVSHESEPFMPPNSPKIEDASLELIREWIDGGAPENKGSKVTMKKKVDLSLSGVPTGKPEGPPPMPPRLPLEPVRHTHSANAVTALVASPWAPLVAVGGFNQVLLYDTSKMELVGVLPFPEGVPEILRFSRNGKLLLAGGGRGAYQGLCVIWDITTGERLTTIGDETDSVLAADISPDQQMVAIGGPNKKVKVFSVATGEKLYEMDKHTDWVLALEFSPDGVLLASADRSGGLVVWEAGTGNEYLVLDGHKTPVTAVSWRTDSNLLASSDNEGKIYLWEMVDGKSVRNWAAHGGGAKSVEFTRDGRVVSCGADNTAKLWGADGKQVHAFPAFKDHALDVTYVGEGDRVVAGDWLGNIQVWNAADAKPVGTLSPNPPTLEMRIAAANSAVTQAQAEATKSAEQVKAADTATKAAAAALEAAKAAIAPATTAKQEAEKAVATLKQQIAASTAARDKAAAEVKRLEPLVAAAKAEVEKNKAAAAGEDAAAKEAATAALPALEMALATQTTELTNQQTAMTAAQTQLAAQQEQLKGAEPAVAAADAALKAAQAKVAPLEAEHKKQAEALAAAQAANTAKQAALTAAQAQVKRWQDELAFAKQPENQVDAENTQASVP